jgi:hypothetical protein
MPEEKCENPNQSIGNSDSEHYNRERICGRDVARLFLWRDTELDMEEVLMRWNGVCTFQE